MNVTKKEISKSEIELTVEVSTQELKPHLIKTAENISKETKIKGFRAGKAPYDVVKGEVGEMAIYQRAMDNVISTTLFNAMKQEMSDVEVVGQPNIKIEKMAPGNALIYKATIILLPAIKLGNYSKISIKKKDISADPKEVNKTLENLRNMHAKEVIKLDKIANGDKAMVKFDVFVDGVAIEGGQADDYPLIIGEGKFIPGFEEQLVGLSKGEKKEFEIRFPKDYHQKNLANKLAKFKVEIKETYKRELPELNDEFAKSLGEYKDLAEIKAGIASNIKQEAENKETQRQEISMLDELVKITTFTDLPQSLIDSEALRMIHELQHSIEGQGLQFADYLTHLNKTEDDLKKDFQDDAKKRVQTALIIKQIAKDQKIEASEEEIKKEIEHAKTTYAENPEVLENLETPSYKNYLATNITNRKVIEWLKKEIIK